MFHERLRNDDRDAEAKLSLASEPEVWEGFLVLTTSFQSLERVVHAKKTYAQCQDKRSRSNKLYWYNIVVQ